MPAGSHEKSLNFPVNIHNERGHWERAAIIKYYHLGVHAQYVFPLYWAWILRYLILMCFILIVFSLILWDKLLNAFLNLSAEFDTSNMFIHQ